MGDGVSQTGRGIQNLCVLKLMPKIGPFKAVSFKIPTQQTEDIYIKV
jgi:hypothetical protein